MKKKILNRNHRDKSTNLWTSYLQHRRQEYTMEKRQPLLQVVDQFSQHHLLKRLSFFHCKFLPPLSKIKLLEKSIGKTLSDINHSRILYDPHPRILEIKAKINKWGLMKLKSFAQQRKL